MQPLGSGVAHICERIPSSLIARNSPGSTSRTNAAPTMSRAADSDATTQPRSSLPITSGRTPWRSRAAYKVCSSIKTSEKAPSSFGKTASALASTLFSSCRPISAVIISVSVEAPRSFFERFVSNFCTISASEPVFVRFPLCARANVPYFVGRSVGWAFTQVLDPVVL